MYYIGLKLIKKMGMQKSSIWMIKVIKFLKPQIETLLDDKSIEFCSLATIKFSNVFKWYSRRLNAPPKPLLKSINFVFF